MPWKKNASIDLDPDKVALAFEAFASNTFTTHNFEALVIGINGGLSADQIKTFFENGLNETDFPDYLYLLAITPPKKRKEYFQVLFNPQINFKMEWEKIKNEISRRRYLSNNAFTHIDRSDW